MNPFDVGDPYVEWNEEIAAREPVEQDLLTEFFIEEHKKMQLDELKSTVTNLLVTNHDFTMDEAEEAVKDSVKTELELWHENVEADELAKHLASDEDDE